MTPTQPCARIFCIGRNYAEHINELSNARPDKPVIFLKPLSCTVPPGGSIRFPAHGNDLQHEVEVVIRIGSHGRPRSLEEAVAMISGITLGLDLTLRDVQNDLKKKGLSWEPAKAFEQSAPLGEFIPCPTGLDLAGIRFSCSVNGEQRQSGCTRDMLFSIPELILAVASIWSFVPGDVIYTGTPSGVGPLRPGDVIEVESGLLGKFQWNIADGRD